MAVTVVAPLWKQALWLTDDAPIIKEVVSVLERLGHFT